MNTELVVQTDTDTSKSKRRRKSIIPFGFPKKKSLGSLCDSMESASSDSETQESSVKLRSPRSLFKRSKLNSTNSVNYDDLKDTILHSDDNNVKLTLSTNNAANNDSNQITFPNNHSNNSDKLKTSPRVGILELKDPKLKRRSSKATSLVDSSKSDSEGVRKKRRRSRVLSSVLPKMITKKNSQDGSPTQSKISLANTPKPISDPPTKTSSNELLLLLAANKLELTLTKEEIEEAEEILNNLESPRTKTGNEVLNLNFLTPEHNSNSESSEELNNSKKIELSKGDVNHPGTIVYEDDVCDEFDVSELSKSSADFVANELEGKLDSELIVENDHSLLSFPLQSMSGSRLVILSNSNGVIIGEDETANENDNGKKEEVEISNNKIFEHETSSELCFSVSESEVKFEITPPNSSRSVVATSFINLPSSPSSSSPKSSSRRSSRRERKKSIGSKGEDDSIPKHDSSSTLTTPNHDNALLISDLPKPTLDSGIESPKDNVQESALDCSPIQISSDSSLDLPIQKKQSRRSRKQQEKADAKQEKKEKADEEDKNKFARKSSKFFNKANQQHFFSDRSHDFTPSHVKQQFQQLKRNRSKKRDLDKDDIIINDGDSYLHTEPVTARQEHPTTPEKSGRKFSLLRRKKINLGGGNEFCAGCGKVVYKMEKIVALGRAWHRPCYSCTKCKITLLPHIEYEVEHQPYCKHHYYSEMYSKKNVK